MLRNIKSLPHTGDLQTKAFQGHYLKHKEIVEFRNISLIGLISRDWTNGWTLKYACVYSQQIWNGGVKFGTVAASG